MQNRNTRDMSRRKLLQAGLASGATDYGSRVAALWLER